MCEGDHIDQVILITFTGIELDSGRRLGGFLGRDPAGSVQAGEPAQRAVAAERPFAEA